MRKRVKQQEMYEQAMVAFRKRVDIGLINGIANSVLEPPNPFQPQEKRRPKRAFVLFLLLDGFFIGIFVYFNFI